MSDCDCNCDCEGNPDKTTGQRAYEGYGEHTGWKSLVSGHILPPWQDLKPEIKAAWDAAVKAVKPCYVLGRESIEKIAATGELITEHVDFIAADNLYHQNPYASQGNILSEPSSVEV